MTRSVSPQKKAVTMWSVYFEGKPLAGTLAYSPNDALEWAEYRDWGTRKHWRESGYSLRKVFVTEVTPKGTGAGRKK